MSLTFIEKWRNAPCNAGNSSEYLLCPVNQDYLHVLYPPLDKGQIKKLFKAVGKTKSPPEKPVAPYEDFLAETNGAELFGGAVVLFGYADKGIKGNEYGLPASLLDENSADRTSKALPQVLYIGNAVFSAQKNIHFYLNLQSGLIAGSVDGSIVVQWANFNDFIQHISQTYDANYDSNTGRHLHYNQREKGVINNIQFFTINN